MRVPPIALAGIVLLAGLHGAAAQPTPEPSQPRVDVTLQLV